MASIVQSLGGDGVGTDLSELTSGEKAFIGLLFTPISIGGINPLLYIGGTFAYVQWEGQIGHDVYNMSLDLSKIASVNFLNNSYYNNGLSMYWADANGNNIGDISADKYGVNSVPPSGANGIVISSGWVTSTIDVRITSFTTTDGRVHTADNLNY